MDFEANVRCLGVWRSAVWAVAGSALAAVAAWTITVYDPRSHMGAPFTVGLAALLGLAMVTVAVSMGRVRAGVLSCRGSAWTFAPDVGSAHCGTVEVALDLGGFLLLRLRDGAHASFRLPVQRAGLDREWQALRGAVYAPPPSGGAPLRASPPPSE